MPWRLVLVDVMQACDGRPVSIALTPGATTTIGREVLHHTSVPELLSRRHAEISVDGGAPVLTDLSLNGTMVDGQGVEKNTSTILSAGATVVFGCRSLYTGESAKRQKAQTAFRYQVVHEATAAADASANAAADGSPRRREDDDA